MTRDLRELRCTKKYRLFSFLEKTPSLLCALFLIGSLSLAKNPAVANEYFHFFANKTKVGVEIDFVLGGTPVSNLPLSHTSCDIIANESCASHFAFENFNVVVTSTRRSPRRASITIELMQQLLPGRGKDPVLVEPIVSFSPSAGLTSVYFAGADYPRMLDFRDDPFYKMAPEVPTTFVTGQDFSFGTILKDDFSRLNYESIWQPDSVQSGQLGSILTKIKNNGSLPGDTHLIRFDIVIFDHIKNQDAFFDILRRDYGNAKVTGAIDFFNVIEQKDLIEDPSLLAKYLNNHSIGTLILVPWLDYDHFDPLNGKFLTRETYLQRMKSAAGAIRSIKPMVKLIGALQSNLFTPPSAILKHFKHEIANANEQSGFRGLPSDHLDDKSIYPYAPSDLVKDEQGNLVAEIYFNGPKMVPAMAIATALGKSNAHSQHLQEQADFLSNEVGLDGFYIDQFSLAFNSKNPQRYDFGSWDGRTLMAVHRTNEQPVKVNDLAFSSINARVKFLEKNLALNRLIVANTPPATESMAKFRIPRFFEAFWHGLSHLKSSKGLPPIWSAIKTTRLSTPLGLTAPHWMSGFTHQQSLFDNLVYNLRNGVAPVFNGSAAKQPSVELPNFFPSTYSSVGEGFLLSDKKLIAAKSMVLEIGGLEASSAFFYSNVGRIDQNEHTYFNVKNGRLTLQLNDWAEIVEINFK